MHEQRSGRHGFGPFAAGFADGTGMGGGGFRTGRKLGAADLQLVILALLKEKARHGYEIVDRSRGPGELAAIGVVTSGGPAPFVGGAIGLGYVLAAFAAAGTKLTIDCRGKDATATVVSGKFYKRG